MKHYLITGGTGLIGSALCHHLVAADNAVTVLSRKPSTVEDKCGVGVKAVQSLTEIAPDTTIDIVINLAGEPIANARWTDKRKNLLESSRIDLTSNLVDWISSRKRKPECLVSGSAVGWYGDGGDQTLTEQSEYRDEYTHRLCDAWEKQAIQASQMGIRVCIVRTGLVLSSKGGVLQKMLLPFKLGLGGRLGTGEQYMPWIHISDMIRLLEFLAINKHLKGIFNVPFGKYKKPYFPENEMYFFASKAQKATFTCLGYDDVFKLVPKNAVIYCDPPYVPLSKTASFTSYAKGGFNLDDQANLANLAEQAAFENNTPVLISNHDTVWTRKIYSQASLDKIQVKRTISPKGGSRNKVDELMAMYLAPKSRLHK